MASHFDKYDAELVRLRQLVARKHEHYPELPLEEIVRLAVEEFNDPQFETNAVYRAYLLEREGEANA